MQSRMGLLDILGRNKLSDQELIIDLMECPSNFLEDNEQINTNVVMDINNFQSYSSK